MLLPFRWVHLALVAAQVGARMLPPTAAVNKIGAAAVATSSTTAIDPNPTLPGEACNCVQYHEVIAHDTCYDITQAYAPLTLDQFFQYNPSLHTSCDNLYPNFRVCVKVAGPSPSFCPAVSSSTSSSSNAATTSTTGSITSATSSFVPIGATTTSSYVPASITTGTEFPPSPTQPGLASDCDEFYYVSNPYDTCAQIVAQYTPWLTMQKLLQWNPALGQNCTGLMEHYFLCVDVPSAPNYSSLAISVSQWIPPWGLPTTTTSTSSSDSSALPTGTSSTILH